VEGASVHVVAEVTLALVLFSDASRVNVTELRRDVWLPMRFLAIGLPLSVAFGSLPAAALFDLPWALAGFIGAALAPTDAALSAQVINDERIPMRLRRALANPTMSPTTTPPHSRQSVLPVLHPMKSCRTRNASRVSRATSRPGRSGAR
jgi:Sodium/hydrogen exchanger family